MATNISLNRKVLTILSILLLLFVSVTSVCAIEDANETLTTNAPEIVSEVDNDELMATNLEEQVIGADENQEILSADGDNSDLANEINSASGTLELTKNYTFTTSSGGGITISKNLEIDGKGHYIDANKQGRVFNIGNGFTVTLKNITIKNGYYSSGNGGAILSSGTLNLINSNFINNYANRSGGVAYSSFGTVENCSFADNYAWWGGAITWSNRLTLLNSNFTNNSALSDGGTVNAKYLTVDNCNFVNNRGSGAGTAIYSDSSGIISNSKFINNTDGRAVRFARDLELYNSTFVNSCLVAGGKGYFENSSFINATTDGTGVITISQFGEVVNCNFTNLYANGSRSPLSIGNGFVSNCIFTNTYAKIWGGALSFGSADAVPNLVENCTFNGNEAGGHGGAIYFYSGFNEIKNCKFNNNSARGLGGAVGYYGSAGGSISNSTFVNNTSGNDNSGGAIYCGSTLHLSYCNFTRNNAGASGGAFRIEGTSTISNCNFVNNTAKSSSAFLLYKGTVENCNIINNSARSTDGSAAGAACINEEGNVLNCNFTNNSAKNGGGGALRISSGIIFNCLFVNNYIGYRGGAILTSKASISDCNFTNNSAGSQGGAIFFSNFGDIENCIFFNNSVVSNSGGAIFVDGRGEIIVNCNFTDNKAYLNGGAIYSRSGTIEYCNFINNTANSSQSYGGAVCTSSSTIGYCNFTNNTVRNTMYGGGALYLSSGEIEYCDFTNNTVDIGHGGAIYMGSATVIYCNFTNNVATTGRGGAIYSSTGSIQYSNFLNNTALLQSGGAIHTTSKGTVGDSNFTNNSAAHGGAISFTDASTVENCIFINNTAIGNLNSNVGGGAIYFNFGGVVSNSNFTNNSKLNAGQNTGGGAIFFRCASHGATGTVDNCNFVNNYAHYNDFGGGAVFIWGTGTVVDCNFTNNSVYSNHSSVSGGGAVYFRNSGSVSNSNFVNNSRLGVTLTPAGGAVFFRNNDGGTMGLVEYSNFADNFADGYGGAVAFIRSGIVYNSSFTNNSVNEGNGGALYFHDRSIGEVSNCVFINNSAKDGGGAGIYISSQANVMVENSKFINNRGGYSGGAISGHACVVTNSTFKDNVASTGGAISISSGSVSYSNFINNSANRGSYAAGAIRFISEGTVEFCNFTNNYAGGSDYSAGTISFMSKGTLSNCNFINSYVMGNDALWTSGAVMFVSTGMVTNCTFTNCSSKSNRRDASGAILFFSDGQVYYSSFINNSATADIYTSNAYGSGAICFSGSSSKGEIYHCNFTNNNLYSNNGGGAIRFAGTGSVVNSTFANNSAKSYGGAIYFAAKGTVDSSNFTYNYANTGSAIYFNNASTSKISNSILLNNKANAKSLNIDHNGNLITITFSGNDNHLNAIYANNNADLEFDNVTYWGVNGVSNTGSDVFSANSNEAGLNITVSISHDDISIVDGTFVTDENGQVIITLHSAGIFDVSAKHDDDKYYTAISNSGTFEISGNETTTKLTVEKTVNGIKLIAKVDAVVNPAMGNVTFTMFNSHGKLVFVHTVNLTNGVAEYSLNHIVPDIYNIAAVYNGNSSNWPSKDSLIYSYKYNSVIIVETESIKEGQVEIINVTLNGNKPDLINATISKLNGYTQVITIRNGQLILSDLEAGTYTVTVAYDGDDEYEAVSNSSTFKVVKNMDYVINITSIVTANGIVNITAVSDFNNSELGGRFEFLLPGNQVIRGILNDDNKTWWFVYYFGGVGVYDIKGQYIGFNQVVVNNSTVTVKPVNDTYEIKLNVTVGVYGSNTTINVTVPSDLKDNVNLTIDGIPYAIKIGDNGTGILNISTLAAGNHFISVTSGSEFYATKTNSTLIVVPKATPKVVIDAPNNILPGSNITITVSVLNVTNGYINIIINDLENIVAVGEDGNATLNITNIQPGQYNVSAHYMGNDNFTEAKTLKNTTLNVPVFNASISVINVTIANDNNVTIIVKVNASDATGTMNVTLPNGKNITASVVDGVAVINLGILKQSIDNYTLPVYYSGDKKYSNNTTNTNFKVGKLNNATVVIVVSPGKYGENTTITVIVPVDADGNVTITVDGKNIVPVVKNTDGTFSVNVTTTIGTHEVVAKLVNDTGYNDVGNVSSFVGESNDHVIEIDVVAGKYGENTTITVKVEKQLKDKVTLTIDGIPYTIDVNDDGKGVLNVSSLAAGGHVVAVSAGNENYTMKTNSSGFNIAKASPIMDISITGDVPGKDVVITVKVGVNATGKAVITVDGVEHVVDVINGNATYALVNAQPGKHNISAEYLGDNNYTASEIIKSEFNISLYNTSLTYKVEIDENNNVTVVVSVNYTGATGKVNITLPNGVNVTGDVVNGVARVNLGVLAKNTYILPVVYSGDNKYNVSSTTANFDVGKLNNATLTIVVTPGKYGEITTITVIVPVDADGNVTISVDGVNISPVIKNTDGTYTVNVTTTLGTHKVNASLVNDTKYNDARNSTTFIGEVDGDYIIGLDVVVRPHGENTTIAVTVPAQLRNNVTLTIDDVEYEIAVNENGTGILNVSILSAGNHVVSVTSGNENYTTKTNSTRITVPKATHSIVIHAPNDVVPGSDVEIRVSVADDAVGYVNIIINGEDNIVAIKNDGNATFTISNIQPSQYNISAKYLGNDNYEEVEAKENKTLNVSLFDASINVVNVTIADNNNVTITVKVDKADATGKVNVTLMNGENITVDIVNGEAVINLGVLKQNNDNYTLPVYYSGNEKYSSNSTYANFKVGKLNNATVIIHIHPMHVSEYTTITVVVPDDADGNVTISVGGEEITPVIKNADGTFTVEVMTTLGIHEVVAKLVNDTKYNDATNTSSFTGRDVMDHVVEITVIPRQYGKNTTIIVDVLPELKDDVNLTIDGIKYSISINEHGSGVLNISSLAAGNHLLEVTAGNYKYITKSNYTSFKVDQANPVIGIVVEGNAPGENVTITVGVDADATGNVVITVDGADHIVDIVNGKASYTVVNAQPGIHNVSAKYLGDNNYTASEIVKSEFVIPVFDTSIEVMQVIVDETNNVTVVVGINYTDATGKVNITLPNGENITADVANGVASINLGVLSKSDYDLNVTYSGDSKYAGNQTIAKFIIGKLNNLTAKMDIVPGKYGENTTITVTVLDDFDGNVTISVDDVEYHAVKVADGIYAIDVVAAVGMHNVTAKLANDTKYNDATLRDSFIALPSDDYDINVTVDKDTVEIKVPSQLKDNVTVIIDDVKRDVVFDENGTGILDISDLPSGTHQITVSTGNENYTAKTYHTTFIKEYKDPDYDDANIIIDLKNRTLNIILAENATGNVTITINNGTYTANVTDGVATFDLSNLSSGEYPLKVEYSGDSNNYPISVNTTITISKLDTPMNITVGDNIVVTVPANATGNITIYANGNVYTSEIKDGNATFASGLTGTIVAIYNGDNNYLANTTVFNIPKPVVTYRVVANDLVMFYLDGSYYTIRVVDSNNNPVSKAAVKILINGVTYHRTTNANGYASVKIKLKPRTYTVISEFNGIKVTKKIKVKHAVWAKKTTKIKKSAKKASIKILVSGPKKKTLTKKVKFTYKGKRKVKVNFGIEMKKQKVKVRFKGKTYKVKVKANGKGTLKLKKKTAKKLKKGKKYKTKVKFKGSKIYSKVKVKVKFLKKTYKVKTNKYGVGKFKINKKAMKKLKKNKKFKKGKKVKYTIAYKNDKLTRYVKAKK